MRILLIDPPFYRFMGLENRYFPIGLGYIAACLRDQGNEVKIYTVDTSKSVNAPSYNRMHEHYRNYIRLVNDSSHPVWREIGEVLKSYKPEVVGITAMTPKIASVLKTATLCKEYNDQIKIITGGPHATIKPDEILQYKDIDFVIRGEGEFSILQLIQAISRNGPESLGQVSGLSFRKDGTLCHNPVRDFPENLDSLPFPARELLIHPDHFTSEDLAIIMTSRGCPFSCTFCYKEMFGKKIRYRSNENVIEEIKYVIHRYHAGQFAFKDDSFSIDRRRVEDLCSQLLNQKIPIHWECTTRVDLIDEDLLRKMSAAGCNTIKVGVESGSEKILKMIRKGISREQIMNAAQMLNRNGIFWVAFFMMGIPNETEEDMLKTVQFLKELSPGYASIGVYEPYPGTELFEIGIKLGLVTRDMVPDQYFERTPDEYYLKDPRKRVNTIDPRNFEFLCDKFLREFDQYNKGFQRLFKIGLSRRGLYFHQPKVFGQDLWRALKWIWTKS